MKSKNRRKKRRLSKGNTRNFSQYFEVLEDRRMMAVDPLGDEQLVNDLVIRSQHSPAVDSAGDRTVVVFEGKGPVDRDGVFAKVYDAAGAQLTDAFRVNSTIRGEQLDASVAVHPDGSFVATWPGRGPGDKHGVFFQRFDAAGNQIGTETLVNETTGGTQTSPVIAALADKQVAIAWQGAGVGDADGIYLRTFDGSGVASSTERLVNSISCGQQSYPAIASDSGNNLIVTWSSRHQDGSDWGIYAQRFDASAQRLGATFAVNSTTQESQLYSSAAMSTTGEFLISWDSREQDGDSWGVYAQRFDADGNPVGDEFRVNPESTGHQRDSSMTLDDTNNLVVSWSHGQPDGAGWEVHAISIDAEGEADEQATRLNRTSFGANSGHQALSAMALTSEGALAATYSGEGEDDHGGVFLHAAATSASGVTLEVGPVADQRVEELEAVTLTVPYSISDQSEVTFSLSRTVDGATIDPSTGEFVWTPSEEQGPGTYAITVVGTSVDDAELQEETTFIITVDEVNTAPVLAPVDDRTIDEDSLLTFTVTASDSDVSENMLVFTLDDGAPLGATIDGLSGQFRWQPSESQGPGEYPITVTVTDTGDPRLTDSQSFTVTVNEVNRPPIIGEVSDISIEEATNLVVVVTAMDPDEPANTLTFSLDEAPDGAELTPETGEIRWSPSEEQSPGVYPFTVSVTDNGVPPLSDVTQFVVDVQALNQPPVLADVAPVIGDEETLLTFTATATDPDQPPDTLVFGLGPDAPVGAAIDPITGVFEWTPTEAQGPGEFVVTVTVSDDGSPQLTDSQDVTITVREVNRPPIVSLVEDQQLDEETALVVAVTATDPDIPANNLTFGLEEAPEGATIDATSGEIRWTPTEEQGPGTYVFRVSATDDGIPSLSGDTTFIVTVNESNVAPVLTVADVAGDEQTLLTFTATATDADFPANTLVFSLRPDAPEGASIDPNSGVFQWVPTEAQGPDEVALTVMVTDSGTPQLTDSQDVTITVREVNRPPVVAAIEDQLLDDDTELVVAATASDPDLPANNLIFTLEEGPGEATINSATGEIRWSPPMSNSSDSHRFVVRATDDGEPALFGEEEFFVNLGNCPFSDGLAGWNVGESGGTDNPGSVVAQNCTAVLTEGDSFVVELSTDFLVEPSTAVQFSYEDLTFDTSADREFINDAFEVALVDSQRESLVETFSTARDAFVNFTEEAPPLGSDAIQIDGQTITVGLNDIPTGTEARLIFRLVNNDGDTNTSVRITDVNFIESEASGGTARRLRASRAASAPSVVPAPKAFKIAGPLSVSTGIATAGDIGEPILTASVPQARVSAGSTVLLSGNVSAQGALEDGSPNRIVGLTVNSTPVDVLDPAGNFYTQVTIPPGQSDYEFVAQDAADQITSATLTVVGISGTTPTVDLSEFSDISASFTDIYRRTSFDEGMDFLHVELATKNGEAFSADTPLLFGIKNITDATVKVLGADLVDTDGTAYFEFTRLIEEGRLDRGETTDFLSIAFSNPDRVQFNYDIVVLGKLNRPPAFTTVPVVQAILGRQYLYHAEAFDLDGDAVTYSIVAGPDGMQMPDPAAGLIQWSPGANDLGTHDVTLRAMDGRNGSALQRFVVDVINPPPNRPPVITSVPVTEARVSTTLPDGEIDVNLNTWSEVPIVHGSEPAEWVVSDDGVSVKQLRNTAPSIFLSDFELSSDRLRGTWRVEDTGIGLGGQLDDDVMGFVFGYQDEGHFYLFDWKKEQQTSDQGAFATRGISVKVVESDVPLSDSDLWASAGSGERVRVLFTANDVAWENFTDYTFDLTFNEGRFTIVVTQGDDVLETIEVIDDTYTGGGFGFYNNSQGQVSYRGFTRQHIPEFTYSYDVEAIDSDLDPLEFALLRSPNGMQINPETGLIKWRPTAEDLAGEDETVDMSLPSAPGFLVDIYADVSGPTQLSFGSTGELFVANGINSPALQQVHHITEQGRITEPLVSQTFVDPDSVLFDERGRISEPGAVLVGGDRISAIHPDGQVITLLGPNSSTTNVQKMAFNGQGELLLVNEIARTNTAIEVFDGTQVRRLAQFNHGLVDMAIDAQDNIYVHTEGGVIRKLRPDGTVINEMFATGLGPRPRLAASPGGVWGDGIYVQNRGNGELYRTTGSEIVLVGTGFGDTGGIAFGPDGSLYVSDFDGDRIIRISPSRETLGLRPNEHPVQVAASDGRGGVATQSFVVVVGDDENHPPVIISDPITQVISSTDTITFETVAGKAPVDGMAITDQFRDDFGVTFSLERGAAPVLAQVGAPQTAFEGHQLLPYQPAPGTNVGAFFLTDDNQVARPPAPLIVDYIHPVSAASGEILDIDGNGAWTIEARGSGGEVLESLVLTPNSPPGPGEALAFPWSFRRQSADIHSIRIIYSGDPNAPQVGLAFDNFSPASAGTFYQYDVDALDPDADTLVYSLDRHPGGMEIHPQSGLISWAVPFDLFGHNLIVNGDAETGDTSGWVDGGIEVGEPDSLAAGFGNFVFTGGEGPNTQTLRQEIDVSTLASLIDAQVVQSEFSGLIQARNEFGNSHTAEIALIFLDQARNVLDSRMFEDPDATFPNDVDWEAVSDVRELPVGTRYIEVSLTTTSTAESSDGHFDELSLVFTPLSVPVSVHVADGRGGTDVQHFTIDALPPGDSEIHGTTVWDRETSSPVESADGSILLLTPNGQPNSVGHVLAEAGFEIIVAALDGSAIATAFAQHNDIDQVWVWNDGTQPYDTTVPPNPDLAFTAADLTALYAFHQEHSHWVMDGLAWRTHISESEQNLTANEAVQLARVGGGIVLGTDNGPPTGVSSLITQHVNQVAEYFGFELFIGAYATPPEIQFEGGTLFDLPNPVDPDQLLSSTRSYAEIPHGIQPNGVFLETVVFGSPSSLYPGFAAASPVLEPAVFNGQEFESVNHILTTTIPSGGIDRQGLEGWTIYLDQNNNYRRDVGERFTLTDENGNYAFTGLSEGTYIVREQQQRGWVQTFPAETIDDNLLVNGSFEQYAIDPALWAPFPALAEHGIEAGNTDIEGWAVINGDIDYIGSPPAQVQGGLVAGWNAADGTRSLDLAGSNSSGGMRQTFTTIPSQAYEVRFQLGGNSDDNNLAPAEPTTKTVRVEVAGRSHDFSFDVDTNEATYHDMKWEERSFTFVAESTSTTLAIFSTMEPVSAGPAIDQVSVRLISMGDAHTVALADGEIVTDRDFGNRQIAAGPNRAPKFTSELPNKERTIPTGRVFRHDARATDPDGDPLTFELPFAPDGMVVDPATGVTAWRPAADQVGSHDVILKVQDDRGGSDLQTFVLNIKPQNTAPLFTTDPPELAVAGEVFQYRARAIDAEGDEVTFGKVDGPADLAVSETAGVVTWTPTAAGSASVIVFATDGEQETLQSFSLDVLVEAQNTPPAIDSTAPSRLRLGGSYAYRVIASDPDADPLTYSLVGNVPAEMNIDSDGLLMWLPVPNSVNVGDEISFTVQVDDGRDGAAEQPVVIEVVSSGANNAPVITSAPPLSGVVNRLYEYNATATDPDRDAVRWSLAARPPGMSVDSETGAVRWRPISSQLGSHAVVLQAIDVLGGITEQTFSVRVRSANTAPLVLSPPITTAVVGREYRYHVHATDPDGDTLQFAITSPRERLDIGRTSGLVTWTPAESEAGLTNVAVHVSDGQGGVVTQQYTIEVAEVPPNQPPIITSTPIVNARTDDQYTYEVSAFDPEGDAISLELLDAPAEMTLVEGNIVSWDPTEADESNDNFVTIAALDSAGAGSTQRFQIDVRPNQAPAIDTIVPDEVLAGTTFRYGVQVNDFEGDPLTFRVHDGSPTDMRIDSRGRMNWKTTPEDIGSHTVTVEVRDDRGGQAIETFTVEVIADTESPAVSLSIAPFILVDQDQRVVLNLGETASYSVSATDNVGVSSLELTVAPEDNPDMTQSLALNDLGQAVQTLSQPGTFVLTAIARDAAENPPGVAVRNIRVIDPADKIAPNVQITQLRQLMAPNSEPVPLARTGDVVTDPISFLTDIYVSVDDDNLLSWQLEYAAVDKVNVDRLGDVDKDYRLIAEGSTTVTDTLAGMFDPTILANGSYLIRLSAEDTNGVINTQGVLVDVVGNSKLGQFRLEFNDLTIPVAGIPIEVTRIYDTFESGNQGDFGFGWSLGAQDAHITESATQPNGDFVAGQTKVFLTKPDGQRVGFTYGESLVSPLLGGVFSPHFVPEPGVTDTLSVDQQRVGRGELFGSFDGPVNFDTYTLTTSDGTKYRYSQPTGLVSVTEQNGNTLDYTEDGIFHSSGESIEFVRDNVGRIKKIVVPDDSEIVYTYDGKGDLRSVTDQENLVTRYEYHPEQAHFLQNIFDSADKLTFEAMFDDEGRLAGTSDGVNATTQHFDPGSFTAFTLDANGNRTDVTYDARGNVLHESIMVGAELIIRSYEYADERHPDLETRIVDRRGMVTDRTYDDMGNVMTIVECGADLDCVAPIATTRFTYDAGNRVRSITNAREHATSFDYDTNGNLKGITNANDDSAMFTYDSQGRVKSSTDFKNNTTTFEYTEACRCGSPSKVTFADNTYQLFTYNHFGQVTLEEFFEADGTLVERRQIKYDGLGRVVAEIDGEGNDVRSFYDGQLLDYQVIVNPESLAPDGTLLESPATPIEDRKSRITDFEYDELDRLIRQIDAEGGVVEFRYDANGNRLLLQDPVGNITTWIYDELNSVVEERDPLFNEGLSIEEAIAALEARSGASTESDTAAGHVTVYAYDGEGNRIEIIDRNGRRREFDYDHAGRLEEERWFEGTSESLLRTLSFTYDAVGNMRTAADQTPTEVDSTLTFAYDRLNRLDDVTVVYASAGDDFPAITLDYEYDKRGNVRLVQDNLGALVESEYNDRNLLEYRKWSGDSVDKARIDFAYNATGRIKHIERFSALDSDPASLIGSTDYTYQLNGLVDTLAHLPAGESTFEQALATYDYGYDFSGLVTSEVRNHQDDQFDQEITYGYDLTGQLVDAAFGGFSEEFNYDSNGNRTGASYVTDTGNRLVEDGSFRYKYDGEGNLERKIELNPDGTEGEVTTFDYDHRNRLIRVDRWSSDPNDGGVLLSSSEYEYDALGRRIAKIVDSDGAAPNEPEATRYVYNGDNVWADFDGQGEVIARYLFGDRIDQILARQRPGEGTAWYLTDRLGSVRDLADSTGQIINHLEYDSFGGVIPKANEWSGDRFMFQGREFDSETGLYYFRSRYYGPAMARFVSADPVGLVAGDPNFYRFVFNSSYATDPSGKVPVVVSASITGSHVGDAALIGSIGFVLGALLSPLTTDCPGFGLVGNAVVGGLAGAAIAGQLVSVYLSAAVFLQGGFGVGGFTLALEVGELFGIPFSLDFFCSTFTPSAY